MLSGLVLAALLGASVARSRSRSSAGEAVSAIALAVGAIGLRRRRDRRAGPRRDRARSTLAGRQLDPHRAADPLTIPARALEAVAYRRARGDPRLAPSAERRGRTPLRHRACADGDLEADLPETTRPGGTRRRAGPPRRRLDHDPALGDRHPARDGTTAHEAADLFAETRAGAACPSSASTATTSSASSTPRICSRSWSNSPDPSRVQLRKLARPPMFVPESKNAAEMLDEFRASRVQIAVVLDEYGGVSGPGHAGGPARRTRRHDRRRARRSHAQRPGSTARGLAVRGRRDGRHRRPQRALESAPAHGR